VVRPRRIRLSPIADFVAASLKPFVEAVAEPGATAITDGWSGYSDLEGREHARKVAGVMAAHVVLRRTHRFLSALEAFLRPGPVRRTDRSPSASGFGSVKR
jgi:hypothetical protein